MVGRIVWDSTFRGEKDTREFRPQLFACVTGIAEALAGIERLAVQAAWVSGPVCEFMEGCTVIIAGCPECRFRRKMNPVSRAVVESPVVLVVVDLGAGVLQNAFSGLK